MHGHAYYCSRDNAAGPNLVLSRLSEDGSFSEYCLESIAPSGCAPQSSLQTAPFYLWVASSLSLRRFHRM